MTVDDNDDGDGDGDDDDGLMTTFIVHADGDWDGEGLALIHFKMAVTTGKLVRMNQGKRSFKFVIDV